MIPPDHLSGVVAAGHFGHFGPITRAALPEAVQAYAARKDLLEVQRIQTALVETMQVDFAKYGPRRMHELMRSTYRHVA